MNFLAFVAVLSLAHCGMGAPQGGPSIVRFGLEITAVQNSSAALPGPYLTVTNDPPLSSFDFTKTADKQFYVPIPTCKTCLAHWSNRTRISGASKVMTVLSLGRDEKNNSVTVWQDIILASKPLIGKEPKDHKRRDFIPGSERMTDMLEFTSDKELRWDKSDVAKWFVCDKEAVTKGKELLLSAKGGAPDGRNACTEVKIKKIT